MLRWLIFRTLTTVIVECFYRRIGYRGYDMINEGLLMSICHVTLARVAADIAVRCTTAYDNG
jgi:hypothetical protein